MQTRIGTSLDESLPEEIQQHIVSFCDARATSLLCQCSTTLFTSVNSLIEHEKSILTKHYLDHYNLNIAPNFHGIIQQPHRIMELCSWASNKPEHVKAKQFFEGQHNYLSHACNIKPVLPPSLLETACRLTLKNLSRELIKRKHPSDAIFKSVIFENNLIMLDELLQLHITQEVNFHTFSIPALLWAIKLGRTDCTEILVKHGATLDQILDIPLLGGSPLSSARGWYLCKIFQTVDFNALSNEMKAVIDPDKNYQNTVNAIHPTKLNALNKRLTDEMQLLTMKNPVRFNSRL